MKLKSIYEKQSQMIRDALEAAGAGVTAVEWVGSTSIVSSEGEGMPGTPALDIIVECVVCPPRQRQIDALQNLVLEGSSQAFHFHGRSPHADTVGGEDYWFKNYATEQCESYNFGDVTLHYTPKDNIFIHAMRASREYMKSEEGRWAFEAYKKRKIQTAMGDLQFSIGGINVMPHLRAIDIFPDFFLYKMAKEQGLDTINRHAMIYYNKTNGRHLPLPTPQQPPLHKLWDFVKPVRRGQIKTAAKVSSAALALLVLVCVARSRRSML